MPGEEMEITTDFGQAGFGEDIDIDLDFAVGQPDEDLELADFDQAQEMQNFNSDTRDELMAEGDDASYGMIDADDIDHNEAATTANDIEIDLGDTDENLWQHEAPQDGSFENGTEIDYVENTDVDTTRIEDVDHGETSWPDASTYAPSHPHEVEAPQVDTGEIDTTDSNPLQDSTVPTGGVDTQDFGLSEVKEDDTKGISAGRNDENELENVDQSAINEQQTDTFNAGFQQLGEELVTSKQSTQEYDDSAEYAEPDEDTSRRNPIHEAHEDVQYQGDGNDVSETGHGQGDNASEQKEDRSTSVASAHGSERGHSVEQANQHDSPNSGGLEHQLGAGSYTEPTNDQESVNQAPTKDKVQALDADESYGQSDEYDSENEDHEDHEATNEERQLSHAKSDHVEHPLSVATRHEMFISYGETDYRLFAKSEDDDPNQYFLRDMSALELPLGQFLSSLREVIADEVSPLDELVMHVDGLGLEFSESSTSVMLEEFTFGEILCLYDRLVKNDGAEQAPDLYTYLMVRPNCRQRLMALVDSADSGRGLSEIAVYRDATPLHDDDHVPVGDYDDHGSYIPPEGEEGEEHDRVSYSPAHEEEGEGSYDYEDGHVEGDANEHDNIEEFEGDVGPHSPSVRASAAEADTEDPSEYIQKPEENTEDNTEEHTEEHTDTGVDGTTADGLIDYSDDELDLSSSKQDQQANMSPRNRAQETPTETPKEPDLAIKVGNDLNQATTRTNGPSDVAHSEATSATATLNGDDNDEIDYSDDDGEEFTSGNGNHSDDGPSTNGSSAPATLQVPINDEITWESENEDAENEPTKTSKAEPKETVQVSPSSGKRPRSDSDLFDGVAEPTDVKRRRPS